MRGSAPRRVAVVFALSALMILVASPPAALGLSFDRATYPTGITAFSVAAADFNGDSDPDLAVVNLDSDTVSILVGGAGRHLHRPHQPGCRGAADRCGHRRFQRRLGPRPCGREQLDPHRVDLSGRPRCHLHRADALHDGRRFGARRDRRIQRRLGPRPCGRESIQRQRLRAARRSGRRYILPPRQLFRGPGSVGYRGSRFQRRLGPRHRGHRLQRPTECDDPRGPGRRDLRQRQPGVGRAEPGRCGRGRVQRRLGPGSRHHQLPGRECLRAAGDGRLGLHRADQLFHARWSTRCCEWGT